MGHVEHSKQSFYIGFMIIMNDSYPF